MSSDFIMDQKLANWRDVRQAAGLSGRSPQAGSYLRNFGTNLRGAFAPARWTKFGAPVCTENSNTHIVMMKPAEDRI